MLDLALIVAGLFGGSYVLGLVLAGLIALRDRYYPLVPGEPSLVVDRSRVRFKIASLKRQARADKEIAALTALGAMVETVPANQYVSDRLRLYSLCKQCKPIPKPRLPKEIRKGYDKCPLLTASMK
jgi:hypothetical protein